MISLQSKTAHQLILPGPVPHSTLQPRSEVVIETGVASIAFKGSHLSDWTRDTLVIPVGVSGTASQFGGGVGSASLAGVFTPLDVGPTSFPSPETVQVSVTGETSDNHPIFSTGTISVPLPSRTDPLPVGAAVENAAVSYSAQAGQPVLTVSLAVYGTALLLTAVSYMAYLQLQTGGIVVVGNQSSTTNAKA